MSSVGCFQCSKRRIVCDGTEPSCRKCQTKGIECSGPGRFRFSPGVAQRGRLKGCRIPVADGEVEAAFERQHSTGTPPQKIRWKNDRTPGKRAKKSDDARSKKRRRVSLASEDLPQTETSGSSSVSEIGTEVLDIQSDCTDQLDFDELIDRSDERELALVSSTPIAPWIAPLDAVSRMYLSYCKELLLEGDQFLTVLVADEIAPVMVVFDELSNGYRDLLVPMACRDELLQLAISSVTAQHLALRQPSFQSAVAADRAALISRLRRDSIQGPPDRVFNISTWSTLIVLLVGETITGSSEYSYLLRTLLCLAQNINQTAPSAVTQFLLQQTHM